MTRVHFSIAADRLPHAGQPCPLCGESHDQLLALMAQETKRRIPSDELLDEEEYLARELVAQSSSLPVPVSTTTRWKAVPQEDTP